MKLIKRPVLRYPGGKFKIAPWIVSHFPPHDLYVEGFGGSASVLLNKSRSKGEVYNDVNQDVVNVFRVLRDPDMSKRLEEVLRLTPFALDEYKSCFENTEDIVENARRMIFRSFAGIGSDSVFKKNGFRYSKHNDTGTMPAESWNRFPNAISSFTSRLQGVVIHNLDIYSVIEKYDGHGTLFYLDPPYLSSTRKTQSVRYSHEMLNDDQHIKLIETIKSVAGKVVLSGYESKIYKDLLHGWICVKRSTIAGSGNGSGSKRAECLWLSPNIQPTLF